MRNIRARRELATRLEALRGEIEEAVLTRIYAIADPKEVKDPSYVEGLKSALAAALEYGFGGIERGEERAPPVPIPLLCQARMAARSGVDLDIVLRRYLAGYTVLGGFLIETAKRDNMVQGVELKWVLRDQAALFDRLLTAVSEEYRREAAYRPSSPDHRRSERIERLLAGEPIDTSGFAYDFGVRHLGMVISGAVAVPLRELAMSLDCDLLQIGRTGFVTAWLGSHSRPDPDELHRRLRKGVPAECILALGEPAEGLAGWRLTHRQAVAAMSVAGRSGKRLVRYSEVALLASVVQMTCSPHRLGSSISIRSKRNAMADRLRWRRCAPISPPIATSRRLRPCSK